MKYLYILLLLPFFAVAQEHSCGTAAPTHEEKNQLENALTPILLARKSARITNAGKTCIPIYVHDILTSAGTNSVDRSALTRGIANLNFYFAPAGIEFFVCGISTYNSDTYYDIDQTTEDANLRAAKVPVTNAFNMYLVNSITSPTGPIAGYASYPSNTIVSITSVVDKHYLDLYPSGTLTHEFGHHFNLYHTHQNTANGPTDPLAENVARSGTNANCGDHGDNLCDTEADPNGYTTMSNCTYTGTANDKFAVRYTPPIDNIMSYYPDYCGGIFTAGQIGRISAALALRQSHTAYTLDCSPASVTPAANLNATQNGNLVDLSWSDLANNELGYLIERSTTSPSAGFSALKAGGVGNNATTFTDFNVSSNTTYYYRIKAVNGGCNSYSNVATITTSLVYCMPSHTSPCTYAYMSGFTFTGTSSINNSTGCSADYNNYSGTLVASGAAGSSYAVSMAKTGAYLFYVQFYIDFNQDGDFDDVGETMLNPNTQIPYSGNITIPANAYNGSTTMRAVMSSVAVTGPCLSYYYGETEDYGLTISGGVTKTNAPAISEKMLSLIPNPSSGKTALKVWSDEANVGLIRIRSVEGTVLQTQSTAFGYGDNSVELDVSALPAGVYMVETTTGSNVHMTRLFKY